MSHLPPCRWASSYYECSSLFFKKNGTSFYIWWKQELQKTDIMGASGRARQNLHKSASWIHQGLHVKGAVFLAGNILVAGKCSWMWISQTASPFSENPETKGLGNLMCKKYEFRVDLENLFNTLILFYLSSSHSSKKLINKEMQEDKSQFIHLNSLYSHCTFISTIPPSKCTAASMHSSNSEELSIRNYRISQKYHEQNEAGDGVHFDVYFVYSFWMREKSGREGFPIVTLVEGAEVWGVPVPAKALNIMRSPATQSEVNPKLHVMRLVETISPIIFIYPCCAKLLFNVDIDK